MFERLRLGIVIFVAAGCASAGSDPQTPTTADAARCRGGAAIPISVDHALARLRSSGYEMQPASSNPACKLDRVVAYMSNSLDTAQSLSVNARQRGHVICQIEREDILPNSVVDEFRAEGKVRFFAENVVCTIYPRGDQQEEQVAELRSALEELVSQ